MRLPPLSLSLSLSLSLFLLSLESSISLELRGKGIAGNSRSTSPAHNRGSIKAPLVIQKKKRGEEADGFYRRDRHKRRRNGRRKNRNGGYPHRAKLCTLALHIGFESAMQHSDTISSSERETRTPRCARRELLHPPKER